ncbi:unnamed protein product [Prunus brigantina]
MKGEYKNLSISLMYVGKISDCYNYKFNVEFQNLVQTFGSKHVNMIEAKPVDNSFLEGTEWILPNLQVAKNKQLDKAQIFENRIGEAVVRFTNYKQINDIEDLESESEEEIHMAFDNLEINMIEHNFDNIVDKLIDDIDNLDEEEYIEKYKTYDLGLHRLSDNEMKDLILNIGLEHILGEKEYQNMLIEVECMPVEDQYSSSGPSVTPASRTDQQNLRQTNEPYRENNEETGRSAFQQEAFGIRKNRIPYKGIEQISLAGNILNLDHVDPQDWEKTIERWEKGCVHASLMLDFSNNKDMLDYFEHTLDGMVFDYFQAWKTKNPIEHQAAKEMFNIDAFVKLIKYEFLDHNRLDGRNEQEQIRAIRNLEQLQICDLQYISEYTSDFFKYLGRTGRIDDLNLLDTYMTKIKGPIGERIWNEWQKHPRKLDVSIGARIQHVYDILRSKCSQIKAKRQIRKQFYMSCKNIDLPKQYGCHRKFRQKKPYRKSYRKYKPYKQQNKNFRTQPSKTFRRRKYIPKQFRKRTNKPWIRKYKAPNKSTCKCYLCGEVGHIRPKCPKLGKQPREKLQLIEQFQLEDDEDLESIYSIDDNLSDNESIYSVNALDSESELDYSSNSDSELDENICMFEEQTEHEEFKYVNLGWPQECNQCKKVVVEKYYTKTIVYCKPCFNNRSIEINTVEIDSQKNNCPSIEKQKTSSLITINCELELSKENKIQTTAMIDTGSTKNVIKEELVPEQFRQKLARPVRIIQFDTRPVYLTHCINNIPIRIERQQFNLPLTFISPVGSYPFILGLNFLKSLQGGFLYTPPDITFFKKGITTTDQSNILESYNSVNIEEQNFKYNMEELEELSKEKIDEQNNLEYDDIIFDHEYPLIGNLEPLEIMQIDRPKNLEELLQLAEQTRIIGEDPQLHWNKNKILAKLDIINPDLTIKTADMPCNLLDKQEFEQQIKELLNLKVIRPSKSRHRSAASVVRKHSELKRGKARIVYNYRRLNDNTYEDSYKLPNKDELMNKIQESKYFSKFDCKSGFWQI